MPFNIGKVRQIITPHRAASLAIKHTFSWLFKVISFIFGILPTNCIYKTECIDSKNKAWMAYYNICIQWCIILCDILLICFCIWEYLFLTEDDSVLANGQWNPWGPWSGCSKSCDGGWQRRVRVCQGAAVTGQQCDGTGEEVRKCSDQRCPGEPMDNNT